jgi:hypothetical protein
MLKGIPGIRAILPAVMCSLLAVGCTNSDKADKSDKSAGKSGAIAAGDFRDSFAADKSNLVPTGDNPYFPLRPGHRLHLVDGKSTLDVSVLDDTKVVDGVTTRVVEERETKNGKLDEVSRNYFAIDKTNNDLYYFGEDVDIYKNDKVVSHEGAWLSGQNGAKFGLMMPGKPKAGDRFYQEMAPKVAMDRAEIVAVDAKLKTPAGTFENCVRTRESSALEGGAEEKLYAPGVGLIKDAEFELAKVEDGRK